MPNRKNSDPKGLTLDDRALFRRAVDERRWALDDENVGDSTARSSSNSAGVSSASSAARTIGQGIIRDNGDLFYRSGVQKNTLKNLKPAQNGGHSICLSTHLSNSFFDCP